MRITHYAAIATASDVVAGDYCDVSVAEAEIHTYRVDDDGNETPEYAMGPNVVMDAVETDVRTDDEDSHTKIEGAAEAILAANGWTRTGPWELADNAAYAPVTPATVHYTVEVSDDGDVWMPENDDAPGTEPTHGGDLDELADDILGNRLADLEAEDTPPGRLRVRLWLSPEHAAAGMTPTAEAVYPAPRGMTDAELRARRELLGVTGDWLAAHLGVNPRTERSWEQGRDPIRDFVRDALDALDARTDRFVADLVTRTRYQARPVATVYRTDDEYHQAHPDANLPASWHRAAVARAARHVPALAITYAPQPNA